MNTTVSNTAPNILSPDRAGCSALVSSDHTHSFFNLTILLTKTNQNQMRTMFNTASVLGLTLALFLLAFNARAQRPVSSGSSAPMITGTSTSVNPISENGADATTINSAPLPGGQQSTADPSAQVNPVTESKQDKVTERMNQEKKNIELNKQGLTDEFILKNYAELAQSIPVFPKILDAYLTSGKVYVTDAYVDYFVSNYAKFVSLNWDGRLGEQLNVYKKQGDYAALLKGVTEKIVAVIVKDGYIVAEGF